MFISQNHDTLYTLTHQPPISHPPWLVDMVALMALDDLVALMALVALVALMALVDLVALMALVVDGFTWSS